MRVLSIFGTRPEIIKMAPVLKALARYGPEIESVTCSTGQHREMLEQVLGIFHVQPDFRLNVMQANQSLSALTSRLIDAIDGVIQSVKPDWILAQGDTTTVFVAALLAYYHHIAFGHVEAGLRTGNHYRPFPEEVNRKIADMLAQLYFAPTHFSKQTLLHEGVSDDRIIVTGNTVVDALQDAIKAPFDWTASPLKTISQNRRLVVITAHRRESFGKPMRQICQAIQSLSRQYPDTQFAYPMHLNPNVRQTVFELLSGYPNISLLDPLDYLSMIHLIRCATLILTDSGGIQEEAPTFQVPTLILRDTTERPEGVAAGVAKLVGTNSDVIVTEVSRLLNDTTARDEMTHKANPYGDGRAAERIVLALLGRLVEPYEMRLNDK